MCVLTSARGGLQERQASEDTEEEPPRRRSTRTRRET